MGLPVPRAALAYHDETTVELLKRTRSPADGSGLSGTLTERLGGDDGNRTHDPLLAKQVL